MRVFEKGQTRSDWQELSYSMDCSILVTRVPKNAKVTMQVSADRGANLIDYHVWDVPGILHMRLSSEMQFRFLASAPGALVDVCP